MRRRCCIGRFIRFWAHKRNESEGMGPNRLVSPEGWRKGRCVPKRTRRGFCPSGTSAAKHQTLAHRLADWLPRNTAGLPTVTYMFGSGPLPQLLLHSGSPGRQPGNAGKWEKGSANCVSGRNICFLRLRIVEFEESAGPASWTPKAVKEEVKEEKLTLQEAQSGLLALCTSG